MEKYYIVGIITLIVFLFSVLMFLWKLSKDMKKIPEDEAGHRKRIFMRFDEYKGESENKFVQKDVCKIIHDFTKTNFERIETTMKEGFKAIDDRITNLNNQLVGWMRENGKEK